MKSLTNQSAPSDTSTTQTRVFRDDEFVGDLRRTERGALFEYDTTFFDRQPKGAQGIATHLPRQPEPIEVVGTNLHPFFAGLIPEGFRLSALLKSIKISQDDLLTQLVASGPDFVGNISIENFPFEGESKAISDVAEISEMSFDALWSRSVDYGQDLLRERMAVPGVQRKISASMISFPIRGIRSKQIHLLKLDAPENPQIVRNEFFFMNVAAACGIETANVEIVKDRRGAEGLLVQRFDRVGVQVSKDIVPPKPRRVHQEDACQFLNRYPGDKYLLSLSEIIKGLSVCSTPILEAAELIRRHAFCYLIGNGDMHGKNISIYVEPESSRLKLTPAYDMLSTIPYGDQSMALNMDGRDKNINGSSFLAFGERHGVRQKALRQILIEIADRITPSIQHIEEIGFDAKKTTHLKRLIEERRKEITTFD